MKESNFFRPIKKGIEQEQSRGGFEPLTSGEYETVEPEPMTVTDYSLSMRLAIQDRISPETVSPEELAQTKRLSELITPELLAGYKQIVATLTQKTLISEDRPIREMVDVNADEYAEVIDTWIAKLVDEVKQKNGTEISDMDCEELRAQCWLFFDALGNVLNTKTFTRDIADFYTKHDVGELDDTGQETKVTALVEVLQARYPLDEREIRSLIQLQQSKNGADAYSPRILAETIGRLWNEYDLGAQKGKISQISLGYLLSTGAESFAPSLFQHILEGDKFNGMVALEYLGLNRLAEAINTKTDIELAKVTLELNKAINERITNSLFFQEFEFIHAQKFGEIYTALERGKEATSQLLVETISELAPSLAGITMSLAFLAKINPLLGAVGLAGLPAMYTIAKKQNKATQALHRNENKAEEMITNRLESVKKGYEEVRTSAEAAEVAGQVKEQMNAKDGLTLQRLNKQAFDRLKQALPFDVANIVAAGVGSALQSMGIISGGAVLSSILYSDNLNRPVHRLVELYFSDFARYIQDIKRMEEILGAYEQLDMPDGEKEQGRQPVSSLPNLHIKINDLYYKDILQGVSLEVQQGEFVTIFGKSGSGKSTLLRTLVGLYKPHGGSIEIGGVSQDQIKKYGDESIYSVMSYCNQKPQIFPEMTFRENLLLWSKSTVDDEAIQKILINLRLDKFITQLDKPVPELSGGELVRLGVARTLIKGAKIMLLDEPTASLDAESATEVRKMLIEIHILYPETTIIAVSHDPELVSLGHRSIHLSESEPVSGV